jgi:hypothetical protein
VKTVLLCAALLLTVTANAASESRATLTGQRTDASFRGGPLLICEYAGARARFEILAQSGKCAPQITVR